MAKRLAGVAEEILRIGAAGHMGFRKRGPGGAQHDGAEAGEHPEAGAPACILFKEAAEHRRHHRGHDEGHGDVGNDAGGFFAGEHVAHHGAGQHDAGRAADGLDEAGGDEGFNGGGDGGQHAGDEEERKAGEQERTPAEFVGGRAVDQLADGHADEIEREGELHGAVGHAEGFLQPRHGGDHQVERQGADGRDGNQDGKGGAGRCGDCCVGGGHGRPYRRLGASGDSQGPAVLA